MSDSQNHNTKIDEFFNEVSASVSREEFDRALAGILRHKTFLASNTVSVVRQTMINFVDQLSQEVQSQLDTLLQEVVDPRRILDKFLGSVIRAHELESTVEFLKLPKQEKALGLYYCILEGKNDRAVRIVAYEPSIVFSLFDAPGTDSRINCFHAAILADKIDMAKIMYGLMSDDASKHLLVTAYSVDCCSPLGIAVATTPPRWDIIRWLITECKVNINAPVHNTGGFALMLASGHHTLEVRVEIVQMLLSLGARVDISNIYNEYESYVLLSASGVDNNSDVIRLLVKAGANVNEQNENGITALHRACSAGHVENCRTLLDLGADASIVAADGMTAFHAAVSKNRVEVCRLLLCRNVVSQEKSIISFDNETYDDEPHALHIAVMENHA